MNWSTSASCLPSRAKLCHEVDIQTIKNRFRGCKIDDDRKLHKTKLFPAFTIAYQRALACTEPKVLAVGRMPTKYKAVLMATALMIVAIGLLGGDKMIGPDTAQSGLVFTSIAMIFEFIPLVTLKRGSRVL